MMKTNDGNVSSDQAFYDKEPVGERIEHEKWMHEIQYYFDAYSTRLNDALAGTSGNVAELGAGSCGLSACLSRLPNVHKIRAVDISMTRMRKMVALSVDILGGDGTRIEPVAADFNGRLPFNDGELDAIFFDAALHHSRSMWQLLAECRRVLRAGGLLVAQRESYLSALRSKNQLNGLLKTPEIAANVSENMYLLEQYDYYLRVHGFDVEFIPRTPSKIKRILGVLNGLLFCDGVLWAKKN